MTPSLSILPFTDERAQAFHDINAQWIGAMYRLEDTDRQVLENPRREIIDRGGDILFVKAEGLGVVGACALQRTGEGRYELTKMGVLEGARGLKAGEFLLAAVIARAEAMGATTLYLLSNKKSAAAIHLYEKLGFVHDAGIMATYGARYERCDVAMLYAPAPPAFTVVHAAPLHAPAWAAMRDSLWPGAAAGEHLAEVQTWLAARDGDQAAFIALAAGGAPIGFVEAALRHDYVNGCDTSPVAFGEALYVEPAWRRRGVARGLGAAVEAWARLRGCTELASDADIANTDSHALHAACGFEETERVVFFRKAL